jgi:hypothetical protein
MRTSSDPRSIPDATSAYHLWDEIFGFSLKLGFSTATGSDEEKTKATDRFLRGCRRSLEERDAMWERLVERMSAPGHGW